MTKALFIALRHSVVVFAVVLVFAPNMHANAQSTAELQAQIDLLLKRVADLQEQLSNKTASSETTAGTCARSISRSLSRGMEGSDVAELQRFLRASGDFTYPEITGYFGVVTERAVQRFQARKGIVSSGTPRSTGYGAVGAVTKGVITSCHDTAAVKPVPQVTGSIEATYPVFLSGTLTKEYDEPRASPLLVEIEADLEYKNQPEDCRSFDGELDWDDNTITSVNDSSVCGPSLFLPKWRHRYDQPGSYTIKLLDVHGNMIDSATVIVADLHGNVETVSPFRGSIEVVSVEVDSSKQTHVTVQGVVGVKEGVTLDSCSQLTSSIWYVGRWLYIEDDRCENDEIEFTETVIFPSIYRSKRSTQALPIELRGLSGRVIDTAMVTIPSSDTR